MPFVAYQPSAASGTKEQERTSRLKPAQTSMSGGGIGYTPWTVQGVRPVDLSRVEIPLASSATKGAHSSSAKPAVKVFLGMPSKAQKSRAPHRAQHAVQIL